MKTLILETSTEKGCIIWNDQVKRIAGGPELSKCLAFEVKNILSGELPELIAVGTGPGSYTGIRVGAALAKALAYGWKIPLLGFCSLHTFGPDPVLVDARSGGFYALIGDKPELISPEDPRLQNIPCISSPHPELIRKRLQSPSILKEMDPNSSHLAKMIYRQFLEEGTPPLKMTYLSCP